MISLNWVKDYIDIENEDLNELAVKVTKAGINVEKVVTNKIDNLIVGEVVECVDHPDSDHLHVCQVNIGTVVTQIVCGASNVRSGLKVIVALPGAILPDDFEIKKSKIRGVESNGMICALYELGLEEKTEEAYSKGIEELTTGKAGDDYFKIAGLDDTLFELDVHKHRNNDCYSHIGFAYEIGAVLDKEVKLPNINYSEIETNINEYFSLKVETEKCPYYLAKMVTNIEVKESPEFIKKRLISAGMRPINNVVDISNYVMLEYGQPLHFFDKDKLGKEILVREASNESLITLDDKERCLINDLVITDGSKPVCLAGVMGGVNTEVDEFTKTILIESAIFDPICIRNTANRLNLRSEASIRFGKGLNFEYTDYALDRACELLEKYASGKVLSGIVKHDKVDKKQKEVTFKAIDINKMLGITIDEDDIKKELKRLDFEYTLKDDIFTCSIPHRRLDIDSNINDIAEEIARLYGYHNLVSSLPKTVIKKGNYIGDVKIRKMISKRLRSLGLNETKTYTLTKKEMTEIFNDGRENLMLPNPMSSDKAVLRTSIIPSLLNVYEYNKARKVSDINLYEISKTYDINYNEVSKVAMLLKGNYIVNKHSNVEVKVDFYLIKGLIENLLDYLGFKNRYSFVISEETSLHPGMSADILLDRKKVGFVGRVHPMINKDNIYVSELNMNSLDVNIKPLKFKEISKYPSIVKDVAFITNINNMSQQLEDVIKKSGSRLLTSVDVFDVYIGEKLSADEKSIAYSLTFNDPTKTLSDEDINELLKRIIKDVEEKTGSKLRDC